jgi:hypothetical protein
MSLIDPCHRPAQSDLFRCTRIFLRDARVQVTYDDERKMRARDVRMYEALFTPEQGDISGSVGPECRILQPAVCRDG